MRIAVVGDVHLCWDDRDVELIDRAGYDLVLFVGDLAGYGPAGALEVARSIAKLRTAALVLPGNHDAVTLPQLAAEVFRAPNALRSALALGMARRVAALARALEPVPLGGYSLHRFERAGLHVVAARPHSIGGPRLGFRRYLASAFGVRTLTDSAARLCALFDAIPEQEPIVVLAHCGPTGLGDRRTDIYGCDFRPEQGDWGDEDLRLALLHARATHKRVLCIASGHMHHHVRGGGQRRWHVERDDVHYVNAARVPRSKRRAPSARRHHVSLTLEGGALAVREVWLDGD
jgi:uncharacterized protein (TIGR04168 family)